MNEVTDYVAQVRTALADLPPSARDELLDATGNLAPTAVEATPTRPAPTPSATG